MLADLALNDIIETIDAIPAGVAILDVEPNDVFRLVAMNEAMASLYQVDREESIGRDVGAFRFQDSVRASLHELYIKARDWQEAVVSENKVLKDDDSTVWTSRTIVPMIEAGETRALMITVTDISEVVRTRAALEQSLSALAGGFFTICAWCKSIRGEDRWLPLEEFVSGNEKNMRQVICTECMHHHT